MIGALFWHFLLDVSLYEWNEDGPITYQASVKVVHEIPMHPQNSCHLGQLPHLHINTLTSSGENCATLKQVLAHNYTTLCRGVSSPEKRGGQTKLLGGTNAVESRERELRRREAPLGGFIPGSEFDLPLVSLYCFQSDQAFSERGISIFLGENHPWFWCWLYS